MKLLVEKRSSEIHLRPRFSLEINYDYEFLLNLFRSASENNNSKMIIKIVDGHIFIKIPKEKSSKEDDLRYCENVTRDLVSWMNKKYGKYFTFKYNCYYRVKKK